MKSTLFGKACVPEDASRGGSALAVAVRRCGLQPRRLRMTWQTPTAIDWRFGFEISLYVANR